MSALSIPESLGIIGNPPNLQVEGFTVESFDASPEVFSGIQTPTLTNLAGDASTYSASSSKYVYTVLNNHVGLDGTLTFTNSSGGATSVNVSVTIPLGFPAHSAYPATIQGIARLQNNTDNVEINSGWTFTRVDATHFSIASTTTTPVPNNKSCVVHYRIAFIAA